MTTVQTAKGTIDTVPKTAEDWLKVRHGAVGLSEAANLLMMPGRHVAQPHEKSDTPGVELEPAEMEVLINKDRAAFIQRAKALHEAGMAAVAAADAKDAQKLFEVGEQIEQRLRELPLALLVSEREDPAGSERAALGAGRASARPSLRRCPGNEASPDDSQVKPAPRAHSQTRVPSEVLFHAGPHGIPLRPCGCGMSRRPRPPRLICPPLRPAARASSDVHS